MRQSSDLISSLHSLFVYVILILTCSIMRYFYDINVKLNPCAFVCQIALLYVWLSSFEKKDGLSSLSLKIQSETLAYRTTYEQGKHPPLSLEHNETCCSLLMTSVLGYYESHWNYTPAASYKGEIPSSKTSLALQDLAGFHIRLLSWRSMKR